MRLPLHLLTTKSEANSETEYETYKEHSGLELSGLRLSEVGASPYQNRGNQVEVQLQDSKLDCAAFCLTQLLESFYIFLILFVNRI